MFVKLSMNDKQLIIYFITYNPHNLTKTKFI